MNTFTKKITTGIVLGTFAMTGFAFAPQQAEAAHYSQYTPAQKDQIIDLLLKLVVARTADNTMDDGMSDAADLRVTMNNLLREHVSVNIDVNRDIVSDSNDLAATLEAEYQNGEDLAAAIGSIFGSDAEAAFMELFEEHLEASNGIAEAIEMSDEELVEEEMEELEEYLMEIATFLSSAIDGLDYDTAFNGLMQHEELVNEATIAFNDGDYEESYRYEAEALSQISGIADALTTGIVMTFPDKF